MLQLHIENGQLFSHGQPTELKHLILGAKVKEVLHYLIHNNISLDLEKRASSISISPLRVDLKTKLINAFMAEHLIKKY